MKLFNIKLIIACTAMFFIQQNVVKGNTGIGNDKVSSSSIIVAPINQHEAKIGFGLEGIDNPRDNYFLFKLDSAMMSFDVVYIDYKIKGLVKGLDPTITINSGLSQGGYASLYDTVWHKVERRLDFESLKEGLNKIYFSPLRSGEQLDYQIRDMHLRFEHRADLEMSEGIAVGISSYRTDDWSYVRGILHSDSIVEIRCEKMSYEVIEGAREFEFVWNSDMVDSVSLYFTTRSGIEIEQRVKLSKQEVNSKINASRIDRRKQKKGTVEKGNSFIFETIEIVLDSSYSEYNGSSSYSALELLQADLFPMNPGMYNVTNGKKGGYRFNFHSDQDSVQYKIRTKLDLSLLPSGANINDVRLYRFNHDINEWEAQRLDSCIRTSGEIISLVLDKEGDFIAGVIVGPESPAIEAYTATYLDDIPEALPQDGVTFISPPNPNNMGDANLSYTLDIPSGRLGIQPNLNISYNSSAGESMLGLGWNLSISSIEVNTKWGAPLFRDSWETESYILDGQELVMHHENNGVFEPYLPQRVVENVFLARGNNADDIVIFTLRNQSPSGFSRIERHGDRPNNYRWVVIDRNGTRYYYNQRAVDTSPAVLRHWTRNESGNIVKWMLTEIEDLYGNTVHYTYLRLNVAFENNFRPINIYPNKIFYTGTGSTRGLYTVEFAYLPITSLPQDASIKVDCRTGICIAESRLLEDITVRFSGSRIRRYDFKYRTGRFEKILLESISQLGTQGGTAFATHTFEYYDDLVDQAGGLTSFSNAINFADPYPGGELFSKDNLAQQVVDMNGVVLSELSVRNSPLYTSTSQGFGFGGYLGLALTGDEVFRTTSAGFKFGYNRTESIGNMMLMDINGDGMPDQVFHEGITDIPGMGTSPGFIVNQIRSQDYNPNNPRAFGNFAGRLRLPNNMNVLSRSISNSFTFGNQVYEGPIGTGQGTQITNSRTTHYFQDFNGDGFIDFADDGSVLFNTGELDIGNVALMFDTDPNTLNPILDIHRAYPLNSNQLIIGGLDNMGDEEDFNAVVGDEQLELIDNHPIVDVVTFWEAPRNGVVKLAINFDQPMGTEFTDATLTVEHIDGAGQSTIELIDLNANLNFPLPNNNMPNVQAGDRLYFRMSSGSDNGNNIVDGTNDILENLTIDIEYNGAPVVLDPFSRDIHSYNFGNDFIPAVFEELVVDENFNVSVFGMMGEVQWNGQIAGEEAELVLFRNGVEEPGSVLQLINGTNSFPDDYLSGRPFDQEDALQFVIRSRTNVDFTNISLVEDIQIRNNNGRYIRFPGVRYEYYLPHFNVNNYTDVILGAGGYMLNINNLSIQAGQNINAGDVYLVVRSDDEVYGVFDLTVDGNGMLSIPANSSITLTNSETLTFSVNSNREDLIFAGTGMGPCLNFTPNDGSAAICSNLSVWQLDEMRTEVFGGMYRGWGVFGYANNALTAAGGINEALLDITTIFPDVMNPPNARPNVYFMSLDWDEDEMDWFWNFGDPNIRVSSSSMQSSRLGRANIQLGGAIGPLVANVWPAMEQRNRSVGESTMLQFTPIPLLDLSNSIGDTETQVRAQVIDLNGDRFPDLRQNDNIVYTLPNGRYSQFNTYNDFVVSENNDLLQGWGLGGNFRFANEKGSGSSAAPIGLSLTNNNEVTTSNSLSFWLDFNGDGLPDFVNINEMDNSIEVRYNRGYSFTNEHNFDLSNIVANLRINENETIGYGSGFGLSLFGGSFSFGVSGSESTTRSVNWHLMDVNGDGKPDLIQFVPGNQGVNCFINTGRAFVDAGAYFQLPANALISLTESIQSGVNGAISFDIPAAAVRICVSVNGGINNGYSKSRVQFVDMDGDGFIDYVRNNEGDGMNGPSISCQFSQIRRTNKLRSFTNPLQAETTMDYVLTPATVEHPNGKWVVSEINTFDAMSGDGCDDQLVRVSYLDGSYNRIERDFMGFETMQVDRFDVCDDPNNFVTRTISIYHTDYYRKGMQIRTNTSGRTANNVFKYTSTDYEYADWNVIIDQANAYEADGVAAANLLKPRFVGMSRKTVHVSEPDGSGAANTMIASDETWTYNQWGGLEVNTYVDGGSSLDGMLPQYRYQKEVTNNSNDFANNILSIPSAVELRYSNDESLVNANSMSLRTLITNAMVNAEGRYTEIIQDAGGVSATYTYTYFANGNLERVTFPANNNNQRAFLEYTYDPDVNTYPITIKDNFNYTNVTDWSYFYGKPKKVTRINGSTTEYKYDRIGRLIKVFSPRTIGTSKTSISFWRGLQARQASTQRFDPERGTNRIVSRVLVDGLGRVYQRKEDAALAKINNSSRTKAEGIIISPKVHYDGLGRTTKIYYPNQMRNTNVLNTGATFYPQNIGAEDITDGIPSQQISYDAMGRKVRVELADASATTWQYGIESSRNVVREQLPNGLITKSYVRGGGILNQMEYIIDGGNNIYSTTLHDYNGMGQLVRTEVNGQNAVLSETNYELDDLGRVISVERPEVDIMSIVYDAAGNVTSQSLENDENIVLFDYDYNRLKTKSIKKRINNNGATDFVVKYLYYDHTAGINAGRLQAIQDNACEQQYDYDDLGNVVKAVMHTAIPNKTEKATFETLWKYDEMGRVQEITYPDGELVKYDYDVGGNLSVVKGQKSGKTYNYINNLFYDKFKHLIGENYGNGVETTYTYDSKRLWMTHRDGTSSMQADFMASEYMYSTVGNVMQIKNQSTQVDGKIQGIAMHNYAYDKLSRLETATGNWRGTDLYEDMDTKYSYEQSFMYDEIGNIKKKIDETNIENSVLGNHQEKYTLDYNYDETRNQLESIAEELNYKPNSGVRNTLEINHEYGYDRLGNTESEQKVVTDQIVQPPTETNYSDNYRWDNANRMLASLKNDRVVHYFYNGMDERILKVEMDFESIYINGKSSGSFIGEPEYTLYVSPLMVVRPNGHYTKHYYAGSKRIVSKIGNEDDYDPGDPNDVSFQTRFTDAVNHKAYMENEVAINFKEMLSLDVNSFSSNFSNELRYNSSNSLKLGMQNINTDRENLNYFFHSDHLGSSSYITDMSGYVTQHIEYKAFGEVFVDEQNSDFNTPYKFNAKEMDSETGLHYYGARYYDSRISRFMSVDPLADAYASWSPYNYTLNNPLKYTDPTGMAPEHVEGDYYDNKGNYLGTDGIDDGKIYVLNSSTDQGCQYMSCDELKSSSTEVFASTQKNKNEVLKAWALKYQRKSSRLSNDPEGNREFAMSLYSGQIEEPTGNTLDVFTEGTTEKGLKGRNGVSLTGSKSPIEGWNATEAIHTHRWGSDSGAFSDDPGIGGKYLQGDIQTSLNSGNPLYLVVPRSNYIGLFNPAVYKSTSSKRAAINRNAIKIK